MARFYEAPAGNPAVHKRTRASAFRSEVPGGVSPSRARVPINRIYNSSGEQRLEESEADRPQLLQTYSGFLIFSLIDFRSTRSPEPYTEQILALPESWNRSAESLIESYDLADLP